MASSLSFFQPICSEYHSACCTELHSLSKDQSLSQSMTAPSNRNNPHSSYSSSSQSPSDSPPPSHNCADPHTPDSGKNQTDPIMKLGYARVAFLVNPLRAQAKHPELGFVCLFSFPSLANCAELLLFSFFILDLRFLPTFKAEVILFIINRGNECQAFKVISIEALLAKHYLVGIQLCKADVARGAFLADVAFLNGAVRMVVIVAQEAVKAFIVNNFQFAFPTFIILKRGMLLNLPLLHIKKHSQNNMLQDELDSLVRKVLLLVLLFELIVFNYLLGAEGRQVVWNYQLLPLLLVQLDLYIFTRTQIQHQQHCLLLTLLRTF